MAVERYALRELEERIKQGSKYRLFKPFTFNNMILFNTEKILTEKDILKLDGKHFGPIEVVPAVEHSADDKLKSAIIENAVKILKTSPLFNLNENHHLDFTKRKNCEKLIEGVISHGPHIAQKLLELYQYSKKLFVHSVNVGIIATIIEYGVQDKKKAHNTLRSEEILVGALLHEIGFLKLPKEMAEIKRVDYNDKQKAVYKTYPLEGRKIAEELGDNIRKKSLDIISQHQERLLGNGFPEGLKGDKIDDAALIIALADDFDLIISKELAIHQKPASEVMSRISRSANLYGTEIVDSFYTWFRYLK